MVCLEDPTFIEYLSSLNTKNPQTIMINCARLEIHHLEFIRKLLEMPEIQKSIRRLTEEDKLDLTSFRLSTKEMSILVEALQNEQLVNAWLNCHDGDKFSHLLLAEKPGNFSIFQEKLALDVNFDLLNRLSVDEWCTLFYDLSEERSREIIHFLFPTENEDGKQPSVIQSYFREFNLPSVLLLKELSAVEIEKLKHIFARNGFEGNNIWQGYKNFKYICDNFLKTGRFDFKDMLDNFTEEEWANIVFSRQESGEETSEEELKILDERCQVVAENSIQRKIQQEKLKLVQAELLNAVKSKVKAEVRDEGGASASSDKPDLSFLREARLKFFESQKGSASIRAVSPSF